jgi:hypothetical protein
VDTTHGGVSHRHPVPQRSHRQHLFIVVVLLPGALHCASRFDEKRNPGVLRQVYSVLRHYPWTALVTQTPSDPAQPQSASFHNQLRCIALHVFMKSATSVSFGSQWTLHRPMAVAAQTPGDLAQPQRASLRCCHASINWLALRFTF